MADTLKYNGNTRAIIPFYFDDNLIDTEVYASIDFRNRNFKVQFINTWEEVFEIPEHHEFRNHYMDEACVRVDFSVRDLSTLSPGSIFLQVFIAKFGKITYQSQTGLLQLQSQMLRLPIVKLINPDNKSSILAIGGKLIK